MDNTNDYLEQFSIPRKNLNLLPKNSDVVSRELYILERQASRQLPTLQRTIQTAHRRNNSDRNPPYFIADSFTHTCKNSLTNANKQKTIFVPIGKATKNRCSPLWARMPSRWLEHRGHFTTNHNTLQIGNTLDIKIVRIKHKIKVCPRLTERLV